MRSESQVIDLDISREIQVLIELMKNIYFIYYKQILNFNHLINSKNMNINQSTPAAFHQSAV